MVGLVNQTRRSRLWSVRGRVQALAKRQTRPARQQATEKINGRAMATQHGLYKREQDQLGWDEKGCTVLYQTLLSSACKSRGHLDERLCCRPKEVRPPATCTSSRDAAVAARRTLPHDQRNRLTSHATMETVRVACGERAPVTFSVGAKIQGNFGSSRTRQGGGSVHPVGAPPTAGESRVCTRLHVHVSLPQHLRSLTKSTAVQYRRTRHKGEHEVKRKDEHKKESQAKEETSSGEDQEALVVALIG